MNREGPDNLERGQITALISCAKCGELLTTWDGDIDNVPDGALGTRDRDVTQCPKCGSRTRETVVRHHTLGPDGRLKVSEVTLHGSPRYGITDARLGILGLLLAVAAIFGWLFDSVIAAGVAFAVSVIVIRLPGLRHIVMRFAAWLTGD